MMMMAMALAGFLAAGEKPDAPGPLGPLVSGRYVERGEDGASQCETPGDRRTLDVYIRAEPPHGLSPNIGLVEYRLSDVHASGFTASGQPERLVDESPSMRIRITGGHINSAGRYLYSITDASLVGHVELVVARESEGDLRLLDFTRENWRSGDPAELIVDAGVLSDGAVLRPFERCAPYEDPDDHPF